VILRLAVLIQYWRVTHTDRHTMMAITHAELAPRVFAKVMIKRQVCYMF